MATKAKKDSKESTSEEKSEDKPVTEADLAALKSEAAGVETSPEEDDPATKEEKDKESKEVTEESKDGQTADDQESEEKSEETFTRKISSIAGDTPEEYTSGLETAYQNSTAEALRLKKELDDVQPILKMAREMLGQESQPAPEEEDLDPDKLYIRQMQDREINEAFAKVSKEYPQLADSTSMEYQNFVKKANILGRVIYESERRIAPPSELYELAVTALGLNKDDDQDKLASALKEGAASSKTSSAKKSVSKSKVTDDQVAVAKKFWPDKSDADIRRELEEYA